MTDTSPDASHSCPRCKGVFECRPTPSSQCACFNIVIPKQVAHYIKNNYQGCLCPACLKELSHAPAALNHLAE